MPTVNFYLKKPEKNSDKCLIYLQFKYSGQKLVYSFGQKVSKDNWSTAKQLVKSNKETTADGKHSLNDLLDTLGKILTKAYNDEMKNGIPTKATLKKYLDDFINKNINKEAEAPQKSLLKLIDRFIAGEIKSKGKDKTKGTLNNYDAVKKHLLTFQKDKNYKIDFDTITLDFFYSYVSYLKKLKWNGNIGLSQNSIAKDIRIIKVFMAEGIDLGWTKNFEFKNKKFAVAEVDIDAVYLTENEVLNLYNFDFSGNKKLEQVRDLFVFGCFTGLRFSDYSNVRPENIVKDDGELYIKMLTQKTNELVIIPCNPIILELFKKYDANLNRLPKAPSNQKFNDYIKDVCEVAGLTEKGRLSTDPEKELYKCISSHTARRSFATNLYLQSYPPIDLMKITGHKTEGAFLKYIRVSKLDTAKRLSAHMKKTWSERILRVA